MVFTSRYRDGSMLAGGDVVDVDVDDVYVWRSSAKNECVAVSCRRFDLNVFSDIS